MGTFTLEDGRPKEVTGRLEKEIRVYDLLDRLGIEYQRVDHEEVNTMEACAAIDELLEPAVICKNLFLTNSAKTEYYLLMLCADKKFRTAEVSKQIGASRLSFADSDKMLEFLDITPGSVSVMGLMNDHGHRVHLIVDEDVFRSEYFGMEKIAPGGGCGGMDALARLDHCAGRKIACINLAIHSLVLNE